MAVAVNSTVDSTAATVAADPSTRPSTSPVTLVARTVVPRPGAVSIENSSISFRQPRSPRPMPVLDL